MVFLYKYLSNNVTAKSCRLYAPIKTTKCENIMKELRRKLLAHAQNKGKKDAMTVRIELRIFVQYSVPKDTRLRFNVDTTSHDIVRHHIDVETTSCVYGSQVLSPEDSDSIMRVTDTSKEAEYQKSELHLKEKFQQLKNEKQKR